MENHQRNTGGNARILETMTRYFRFPPISTRWSSSGQIQQGLAIKTAIEYWRSTKPRCMGTLFWQINDTYPVASWASLDYGGQWKLLHYMAKRFFLPVNVVAVPDKATGDLILKGINDTAAKTEIGLEVQAVDVGGKSRVVFTGKATVSPDAAASWRALRWATSSRRSSCSSPGATRPENCSARTTISRSPTRPTTCPGPG